MRSKDRFWAEVTPFIAGSLLIVMAGCCPKHEAQIATAEGGQTGTTLAAETKAEQPKSVASFVANPFCRACHLDFDEEELARNHELAGIGCERCHGESFRHRSDEANVTAPELMYPKARVNPTCMMCHPRHAIEHVNDHRPVLEVAFSIFETTPSDEQGGKYCTDCHGSKHRMNTRNIRWNQATGELLK